MGLGYNDFYANIGLALFKKLLVYESFVGTVDTQHHGSCSALALFGSCVRNMFCAGTFSNMYKPNLFILHLTKTLYIMVYSINSPIKTH